MNKTQLSIAIAADTGLGKTPIYDLLTAVMRQLDAEAQAGRAVEWAHFGTFWPRRKMGLRTGHAMDGGEVTYDNWKLIPDPEIVDEAQFIQRVAQRALSKAPLVAVVLQSFKAQVVRTLRTGRRIYYHGHGAFKVGRKKARVYHLADGSVSSTKPAKFFVVYQPAKGGLHQKFVALAGLM